MRRGKGFTSVLRVPYVYTDAWGQVEDLLREHKRGFTGVMIFAHPTHDLRGEEFLRDCAAKLTPCIKSIRSFGLSAGVDVLSTIGHHCEMPDHSVDDLDFAVSWNGKTDRGRLCPTSEKNISYIKKMYGIIAESRPDFIYSDDDLDYNGYCYCEHCLSLTGNVTREEFLQSVNGSNAAVTVPARRKALNAYKEKIQKIYGAIRSAVHEVSPGTEMGFMTCTVGYDGDAAECFADALRSDGQEEVLCRPGGGVWSDAAPADIVRKANAIGRQIRNLHGVHTESEIENLPYQPLTKSARAMLGEVLCNLAAGCNGTIYNFIASTGNPLTQYAEYFTEIKRVRGFAETTEALFCGASQGVGWFLDERTATNPDSEIFDGSMPFDDTFFSCGLPAAYKAAAVQVYLLNRAAAETLSDAQVMFHLRSGVFMDGGALVALVRRGFGRYCGFRVTDTFDQGLRERTLATASRQGGTVRNSFPEFSVKGHAESQKAEKICAIEATEPGARYISELIDYTGGRVGYASGKFENELGGRICVGGYSAFGSCYDIFRTQELKNTMRWLSRDTLSAYVSSFHKAAIWPRATQDGRRGAQFFNLSLDEARGFSVAVLGRCSYMRGEVFAPNGRRKLTPRSSDFADGYTVFRFDAVPAYTFGYFLVGE